LKSILLHLLMLGSAKTTSISCGLFFESRGLPEIVLANNVYKNI
jgi:hypothetical protein